MHASQGVLTSIVDVAIAGNRAIEQAAIDFVIEQERRQGRTARDMRSHGAGDLESDGRIIEVKAFGGSWSSGMVTTFAG